MCHPPCKEQWLQHSPQSMSSSLTLHTSADYTAGLGSATSSPLIWERNKFLYIIITNIILVVITSLYTFLMLLSNQRVHKDGKGSTLTTLHTFAAEVTTTPGFFFILYRIMYATQKMVLATLIKSRNVVRLFHILVFLV